ncbi:M4WV, histidine kinase-group IX protein [Sclerotinia borealis F-4128]|uniref:histidine kinase n=1 Tax=Sclerotinia borealis (strain F-4128) TaxID=1432307 RepID=W9CCJ7_SCLBF|nr:M4WV, histidine kinase-group IX protein [Sclerotinia borealis F-4128]
MMHRGKNDDDSRPPDPNRIDIDLQLSILRYLPTPVLVLDQNRKALWTNWKAEALLGGGDSLRESESPIIGKHLDELGVRLLDDRSWAPVLKDVELSRLADTLPHFGDSNSSGGFEVVVNNAFKLKNQKRFFRVCIEVLNGVNGIHFIFSFELSTSMEGDDSANSNSKSTSTSTSTSNEERDPQGKSTLRTREQTLCDLRNAVFESVNTAAFFITADEGFHLPNRKVRDILGDVMGDDEDGHEGLAFLDTLEVWDETYTHQLPPEEYPGAVLIRTRQPFTNYRCGFLHPTSGNRMTGLLTGECLYDETTGDFLGAIIWCDIQDYGEYLMEKQDNLLRSHETICDLMPHLVWTATPDGKCDWYSERWYQFTGMSKEECLGTNYKNVIHPEDLPLLLEKWIEGRGTGEDCEVEIRYLRHDGIYRWMHTRACPLLDDNGEVLKWYGTNTDITDIVLSRIEAKRNKHQMLTVLAHTEVNLFCVDEDRLITMAEGGMLWGTKTEEMCLDKASLTGRDVIELMQSTQPGGIPGHERSICEILAGKVEMVTCEEKIGERSYRTRLVADLEHNSDDVGKAPKVIGCLGFSIDITDVEKRAQLEMDNTRLMIEEQAAKDSSKLKSQFLANMSHEMRTPTAGVIGMVDLLSEDESLTSSQREYVSSIQLSGRALLTIVNDILDFSKIESGRLDIEEVPFSLCSTVGELCKLLSVFANQKNLDFTYKNEIDESLEVLGDPGRIRQVLSNLLTNSLKFTENGSIEISAKWKMIPQSDDVESDIMEVTFVIKDTGIGISKTTLDKLFKPFSQGDSSTARLYGGTGLGLTISRNLATLMSGTIALDSDEGIGSTATFKIPLKISSNCRYPQQSTVSTQRGFSFTTNNPSIQSHSSRSIPHRPALHRGPVTQQTLNQQISTCDTNHLLPPYLRNERNDREGGLRLSVGERAKVLVLVVEDNAINQTIALKTIQNLGFQATAVWNGREALNYLSNPGPSKPRPDIILMDVQMPIMDGYEATRLIRTNEEYERDPNHDKEPLGIAKSLASMRNPNDSRSESQNPTNSIKPKANPPRINSQLRSLPIIAMTASAIQGDQEKCIEAGMDGYLSKPVEKERLEETLVYWVRKAMNDREPTGEGRHGKNDSGVVMLDENLT